ncbi:MAG: ATP synthase F0 subunit B [Deferribacteres bacterium]|nr:ATP synthase F0 subunit B [Deferribacteres bacterium]
MLELNIWFFVQLANFLILLYVLNIILFRPFMQLFRERKEGTEGALEKAKAMEKEKEEIMAQIDAKLADARAQAKKIFEDLSKEGMDIQRSTIESAQNEAVEINRKAKAELEAATEKARAALKADVEAFSKQIVEKLVGTLV